MTALLEDGEARVRHLLDHVLLGGDRDELLVAARDDAAITRAAEKMKDAYLDLLSVMARVTR